MCTMSKYDWNLMLINSYIYIYVSQVLKLFDGGEVSLDWTEVEGVNEDSPICLFLPVIF